MFQNVSATDSEARAIPTGWWWVIAALIITAAVAVRLWGAQDELWFDELWSFSAAQQAHSPRDVFSLHHDNNHYLVTLWMYWIGPDRGNSFVYRIPSVIAGIGSILLCGQLAARWGRFASLAAIVLSGASYMLIVYGTEARGYALAGFFSLLAFLAVESYLRNRSIGANIAFALTVICGTLAHLTFVQCYFGVLVWSVFSIGKQSDDWRQAVGRIVPLHLAPMCFLMVLYVGDVRGMEIGGGDPYVLRQVLAKSLALGVGVVARGTFLQYAAATFLIVLAVAALVCMRREGSDQWIFFAATIFVAPALLLAITEPRVLYERYFYVNVLFLLLLQAYFLSRVVRGSRLGTAAAILYLTFFALANARPTYEFLKIGRGHFRDALAYMVVHSSSPEIQLAGSAEFCYRLYSAFYLRHAACRPPYNLP